MERRNVKYKLGPLSHIDAETFGEPGRRTFRLTLEAGNAHCYTWLEKEQLFQLGAYLQETVEGFPEQEKNQPSQPREPEWSGDDASVDFKVAQLFLSHDREANSFYFLAYENDEEQEEGNSVSFWITVPQAQALAAEALRICAAGRPRCFLCGLPINPDGHVCPRANGHTVFEAG